MTAYAEQAATFTSGANTLLGVTSLPAAAIAPNASTGIVIIVGGPQYRAGSHRQFVLLARALASAGHPVLRFDYSGMGDSDGAQIDFESANADIAAAIDHLFSNVPSLKKLVLWGLCDGASAALLYMQAKMDPRVAGLCLLNPWVRSVESLARTQVKHYYIQRLRQREFWSKLLSGKVATDAVTGLWANLRLARGVKKSPRNAVSAQTYQQKMATAWRQFDGKLLLLLSGNDYTAKEFLEFTQSNAPWAQTLLQANVERHDLVDADHTFSSKPDRLAVEELTLNWLQKMPS